LRSLTVWICVVVDFQSTCLSI